MRDKSLDIIKGLACILMIFAHSKTLGRTLDNSFTEPFWYLGFFAPILFFGSIGVSLTYQLKRRKALVTIIFNVLLFLVSFADRGRESLNYINFTNPNLIGSLALATILIVVLRKFNGLVILIVLIILDRIFNRIGISPTILYGIPFALIPWAGITSLGKFLQERKQWLIWVLAAGVLITFYYYVVRNQVIDSQFLTTLFLGMSFMIYSLSAIFSSRIEKIPGIGILLTYLGKNTLLFYWVHLFLLFQINFKLSAPLMWSFVLITSIIFMMILKKINSFTLSQIAGNTWFWVVLVPLIFIPLIIKLPLEFHFYYFNAITIVFALNYNHFFKLGFIKKIDK